MNELGLLPTENKVFFGQLLGMCDQISFPLGEKNTQTLSPPHSQSETRHWPFLPYVRVSKELQSIPLQLSAVPHEASALHTGYTDCGARTRQCQSAACDVTHEPRRLGIDQLS